MDDGSVAQASTETLVALPVINPDTGRSSRTFTFVGKADRIEGGKVIDWKSATDPAAFIQERRIGFQPELYALALIESGHTIREIEYRIIAKPTIRFCGKDKTAADYEQRCCVWLCERPDRLVTHTHILTDSRLTQARQFLWDCSRRIIDSRANDRWIPSAKACSAWSRTCEYMPLCEAVCDWSDLEFVEQMEFDRLNDPHQELETDTCKGVLTFSSLSCLTLCEVKYYWRYEQRLRRRGEHSDALWLGSAMHVGLDAYASGGLDFAFDAIGAWADSSPVLGPDATHKQEQEIAKARAMVWAAAAKWRL